MDPIAALILGGVLVLVAGGIGCYLGRRSRATPQSQQRSGGVPMDEPKLRVLRSHNEFLNAAIALLHEVPIEVSGKPGQVIVFALVARVVQLGCALQDMLERGYGSESHTLARSMISAMANVVAIVDADVDGRALQFMLFSQKWDETLIDRAEKYEIFEATEAARHRREVPQRYKALTAMFAKHGVTPTRISSSSERTWHGLNTERELFAEMKMPHVYELDYAWLSDEGHVNIGALLTEIQEAFDERTGFGPKGEVPKTVLMASALAIPEALVQLSNLLGAPARHVQSGAEAIRGLEFSAT